MQISQPRALNEIGRRTNNEDSIYPPKGKASEKQRFFIVCDGIGGHENGEMASETVCDSFAAQLRNIHPNDFNTEVFENALDAAYNALDEKDRDDAGGKKMGTTLAFLHLNDRQAFMAHIGDSRIYHIRKNKTGKATIIYKTSDHSLVNELLQGGIITKEEAAIHPKKNVITRAMQPHLEKRCKADFHISQDVAAGDCFFLCTDGILESITDGQLCSIVEENTDEEAIINAIHKLCEEHSRDNYSAYLIPVIEGKDEMITVFENEAIIVHSQPDDSSQIQATVTAPPVRVKKKPKIPYMMIVLALSLGLLAFGLYRVLLKNKTDKSQPQQTEKPVEPLVMEPETPVREPMKQPPPVQTPPIEKKTEPTVTPSVPETVPSNKPEEPETVPEKQDEEQKTP